MLNSMSTPTITNRQLLELVKAYWQWRALWIMSTLLFAALGIAYVTLFKLDTWVASQGVIVRDEANGAVMRLGRFQSQTEMKTAQETIQEMARNAQVLHAALTKVGREPSILTAFKLPPLLSSPERDALTWPSTKDIEDLAKNGIEVRAPRGAELGTTEVIYLDVKQNSRSRALELNKAVCQALEDQLQTMRRARADGVIAELRTAKSAAEKSLAVGTERLRTMEAEAGTDLADLRGMTDTSGGGNTNRQVLDTIKAEIRQVELKLEQLNIDLQLAQQSFDNPDDLLLTPGRLVTDQPGLKKLREGLADATIKTSELKGRFTENNVLVKAAIETEARIRQQLRKELSVTVGTISKDVDITSQQLAKLRTQQELLENRLNKIAGMRADYANTVSDVRARNTHLQEIQRELAEAEAAHDAAATSSLLTRLDTPLLGERPLGPGRTTIVAGATVCGLFFGLGIVFLLSPLDGQNSYGRRRQDLLGRGRRREDLMSTANQLGTDVQPGSLAGFEGDRRAAAPAPNIQTTECSGATDCSANEDCSTAGAGCEAQPKRELESATASSSAPASSLDTNTLLQAKLRACDVLTTKTSQGRKVSPAPSRAAETVANSTASLAKIIDENGSGRFKLSELSNQPPQPKHKSATSPVAVASATGESQTSTEPRKPLPTPWTTSTDAKPAAIDRRFANNALLGEHGVNSRRSKESAVIVEVVAPTSNAATNAVQTQTLTQTAAETPLTQPSPAASAAAVPASSPMARAIVTPSIADAGSNSGMSPVGSH